MNERPTRPKPLIPTLVATSASPFLHYQPLLRRTPQCYRRWPLNYRLFRGTIVFRTSQDSSVDEDLRTGIEGAEFKVAFEVDSIDTARREGWSVLVQGTAHHVDSDPERAEVSRAGVEPWPGGERELFIRIAPRRMTGRRIRRR
jgi:nitroimidazol reductase NimA-like FMN-containing flavoprotein (pyridoxamine 5'-phosphate oxidase superfamily)